MRRRATLWVQLLFLVVFLVTAVWLAFLRPPAPAGPAGGDAKARCEARGDWWDDQDKVCAVPMPVTTLTHRPAGR